MLLSHCVVTGRKIDDLKAHHSAPHIVCVFVYKIFWLIMHSAMNTSVSPSALTYLFLFPFDKMQPFLQILYGPADLQVWLSC